MWIVNVPPSAGQCNYRCLHGSAALASHPVLAAIGAIPHLLNPEPTGTGAPCGHGLGWSSGGRCGGGDPPGRPVVDAAAPKAARVALPLAAPGPSCSTLAPPHPVPPLPPLPTEKLPAGTEPWPPAGGHFWLQPDGRPEARIGLQTLRFLLETLFQGH